MVRHPYLAQLGMACVAVVKFVMPKRYSESIERRFYKSWYWKYAVNDRV